MKQFLVGIRVNSTRVIFLYFLMISACAYSQQSSNSLSKDTQAILVSGQFSFTEGPAVDKKGNIFFTDQPNNKIWKYDVNGKLSIFLDTAGRSNGLYFDRAGNLITCADEKNELWLISPEGKVTVLLKDFQGHQFNGPNDLWIDHNDGIYFTDPYFQRNYWKRKAPDPAIKGEKLYYLPKGKKQPVVVDEDLKKPNGIVGEAGKFLFVSDMGVQKIYRYAIGKDGNLQDRRAFASDIADGMTLDNKGNLYLAGNGITVYDANGNKIDHFDIPQKWTANVCFGGPNKDILFITASEAVYIMRMNVKGID